MIATTYKTYYEDVDLERCEVLQAAQQWTGGATVLYPGSAMHITASFFFQHVVYVDRSAQSRQFFAHSAAILDFITGRKRYKQAPYVRFVAQNYCTALPLRADSFDLLLSLYAGGIAQACRAYLKPGGVLLTNNHHDDAGQAARASGYQLVAVMDANGGVTETGLDVYFIPRKERPHAQTRSMYPEYTHNADYYLFRKIPAR